MTTDFHESVTAARRGDRAAFDTLFARNLPPLIAFIRMKVGRAVAARDSVHDLAQSVCRELLADMDDFEYRGETEFRNWLFLQASRKIVDRARYHQAEKRDVRREQTAPPAAADDAPALLDCYATFCTPSCDVSAQEELARIHAAIDGLPEKQREAIALSRVLALPYPEVAARMATTESAVRGLVARGLATLSVKLRPTDSP